MYISIYTSSKFPQKCCSRTVFKSIATPCYPSLSPSPSHFLATSHVFFLRKPGKEGTQNRSGHWNTDPRFGSGKFNENRVDSESRWRNQRICGHSLQQFLMYFYDFSCLACHDYLEAWSLCLLICVYIYIYMFTYLISKHGIKKH